MASGDRQEVVQHRGVDEAVVTLDDLAPRTVEKHLSEGVVDRRNLPICHGNWSRCRPTTRTAFVLPPVAEWVKVQRQDL